MAKHYRRADNTFAGTWVDGAPTDDTLVEVSTAPADGSMVWDGSAWVHPAAAIKALAADKRYRVETAGVTALGAPIKTDRESQGLITGAAALTKITGNSLKWKTAAGFVNVSAAQIEAIAVSVGNHVQACFSAEEQILALIDADTITTAEQVDAWEGWP